MTPESFNGMHGLSDGVLLQLKNLGIPIDAIQGKILDVGAGDGELARAFAGIEAVRFTSIDPGGSGDVIAGSSDDLPFGSDSFDCVVSHASVPNVFIGLYEDGDADGSRQKIYEAMLASVDEMLRVVKSGGEVRLSPVLIANNYPSQKTLSEAVQQAIASYRNRGVEVSFERFYMVENQVNGEKTELWRLVLKKPLMEGGSSNK